MATEILSTFGADLAAVTLVPGTGGVFTVEVDDNSVWDRTRDGGFPDIVTLKQRVRDVAAPDRDLGHGDSAPRPELAADHSSRTTEDMT